MKYILNFFIITLLGIIINFNFVEASYHFSDFRGIPPIHIYGGSNKTPIGITPNEIKKIYNLPTSGGKGTIAIIDAYDTPSIEKDLADFNSQFNLKECSTHNGCFEKHLMNSKIKPDSGWALETALDVEWAHAIAPNAKILLIEATTPSGANLLKAVDYATSRKDIVAISMSWGGSEFPEETNLDKNFISKYGAIFFASSGDNGAGASWPASSPNVIGVGGTTVNLKNNKTLLEETAWSGSGGGVSAYEKQPSYQTDYSITKSNGMRAIPDVSYNADPQTGFPVVRLGVWRTVGGTSAGAPQWAAITSLGKGLNLNNLYSDKATANNATYFRDIISGSNGDCKYYCNARRHYDYVTGLGSPLTINF